MFRYLFNTRGVVTTLSCGGRRNNDIFLKIRYNRKYSVINETTPRLEPPTPAQEEYTRVDPVDHVLLRPGMYVGATQRSSRVMWVVNQNKAAVEDVNKNDVVDATLPSSLSIAPEKISFTPALYKIFDEILANAADNVQRDTKMTKIKVDIDKKKGEISIFNVADLSFLYK